MNENDKLLDTLHTQFAENQNHHQRIFIQFLIALFVLFGGYGYVYTHTNSEIEYNQTIVTSINDTDFYSLSTLITISALVISILTLLNAIILNLGYGFRRDQHINKIIRKKYLVDGEYENVFGKLYDSGNKGFFDFLPNFYSIFYFFILGFQILLLIITCCKEKILNFDGHYWSFTLLIFNIILIIGSFCLYRRTYHKYTTNIKKH